MTVYSLLRRDNISRFRTAVQQDGWRVAARKAGHHLKRIARGHGQSAVPDTTAPRTSASHLSPLWRDIAANDAFHISQAPAILTKARRIVMIGDMNLPQCRKYRVEQLRDLWTQKDIDYQYAHYQDVPRACRLMQDATHVMLYRMQSDPLLTMYLYEARRLRLPILYDIDDPLFSISAYETYENMKALPDAMKTHFVNEAPRYLDALNSADIVTVSTPGLRDHARLYSTRPIYTRRNFADQETLAAAESALSAIDHQNAAFRVAFASGSRGHEVDFALVQKDVARFLSDDPTRRLMILGHFDDSLLPEGLKPQIERHDFTTYGDYLAALARADCAIMPLTDDTFNRCKSAVRVLDASSVAVPSIVASVGDMANVVRDGDTGTVLEADQGWYDALNTLANDRATTSAMGASARADLIENWSAAPTSQIIEPEIIRWVSE